MSPLLDEVEWMLNTPKLEIPVGCRFY